MKELKPYKWSILIIFLHLIIVLFFNQFLDTETQIPRQWNLQGEVSSYSSKAFGLWFLWGLNALLVALFAFFRYIDPRYRKHKERFTKVLPALTLVMAVFLMLLHIFSLLWASGIGFLEQQNFIVILVGLMFMFLGNILPKIPSNFFAGFRSPWTLSSEKIWHKTHRLGGYLFFLAGFLMILRGLFFSKLQGFSAFFMFVFISIGAIPFIYSYVLYRKKSKKLRDLKEGEDS